MVSNHRHSSHFKWRFQTPHSDPTISSGGSPLSHRILMVHDITIITCQSSSATRPLKVCAAEVSNFWSHRDGFKPSPFHLKNGFKPSLIRPFQVVVSNPHWSNHFKWWWPLSHRTLIWYDIISIICQSLAAITELKFRAAEVSNFYHPRSGFKPSLF